MRRQSGTTDLRAPALHGRGRRLPATHGRTADEEADHDPDEAERAFGVGVVLSTQNRSTSTTSALSNAGTWMIGRLQTDRDKMRLLDGMSAASGGVDVAAIGDTISGLGKRQFVLKRAGKDHPELFTTRWAMSYLRWPAHPRPDRRADGRAQGRRRGAHPAGRTGTGTGTGDVRRAVDSWGGRGRHVRPTTGPAAAVPAPGTTPAPGPLPASPRSIPTHRCSPPRSPRGCPSDGSTSLHPGSPRWAAARGTRLQATAVARITMRFDDESADLVHDEEYEVVVTRSPSCSTSLAPPSPSITTNAICAPRHPQASATCCPRRRSRPRRSGRSCSAISSIRSSALASWSSPPTSS
ncbi:MAG: hypothetical protein R2713_20370 [Ilumatobacteraceae bacterium]